MTIQYEMDKLNFDWKINKTGFEFIPGSIEFFYYTTTRRKN